MCSQRPNLTSTDECHHRARDRVNTGPRLGAAKLASRPTSAVDFARTALMQEQAAPTQAGTLSGWQIRAAIEQLGKQRNAVGAVSAAASACRISRSHFSRAFKASIGLTPTQWHLEWRVAQAEVLLEDPRVSLVEIADRCGFADQSHLTHAFGRLRHLPPGAWRRQRAVARACQPGGPTVSRLGPPAVRGMAHRLNP